MANSAKPGVKRIRRKVTKKTISRSELGEPLAGLDQYPDLMKPGEVQQVLRVSRATIFRMLDAGTLPGAVRVHGSWRILRDKLRQYLLETAT